MKIDVLCDEISPKSESLFLSTFDSQQTNHRFPSPVLGFQLGRSLITDEPEQPPRDRLFFGAGPPAVCVLFFFLSGLN